MLTGTLILVILGTSIHTIHAIRTIFASPHLDTPGANIGLYTTPPLNGMICLLTSGTVLTFQLLGVLLEITKSRQNVANFYIFLYFFIPFYLFTCISFLPFTIIFL